MSHGQRYKIPDKEKITDTTPLRLEVAAEVAFPDGSMGVPGLRSEIRAGRLPAEKIAGRIYVTLAGIGEMRERCRMPSSSQRPQREPTLSPDPMVNGMSVERASLLASLARPINSKPSSRRTTRQSSAPVIQLKSE